MNILFCPLAGYGFVNPLIGIAKALHSRGHAGMFVTGPAFTQALDEADLSRIPRGAQDGPSFDVATWGLPLSVAIQIKHIKYALDRFSADMLVTTQLALGPLLAAEIMGLPVAVLSLATYLWPLWPLDHKPKTEQERRLQWRYADMMSHYNKARSLVGLSPTDADHLTNPLLGDLFMLQSVPELEQNKYEFPSKVHFVGSCGWEPQTSDMELSTWLDECKAAAEPIIYVQAGRSFHLPSFWPPLRDTLKDKPLRIVAASERMDGEVGSIPNNFFVRAHVPQGKVLPYSSAVIATGHTTAVLGALTHGLPSLLFPTGSGSDDIAEHCEQVGAALCLHEATLGPGVLEKAVDELLVNNNLRQKAEYLRIAFARAGGISRAAELIESIGVSRRKPDKKIDTSPTPIEHSQSSRLQA
jgi:MGT family glycosyltransferase